MNRCLMSVHHLRFLIDCDPSIKHLNCKTFENYLNNKLTNCLCLYRPLSSRLVFFKQLYLTLNQAVLVHFNKVFGLSLLFCLISKLISVSIGCHSLIHQIVRNLNIGLFWFLTIPDVMAMFVIFQSADYVRGQVGLYKK